MPEQDKSLNKFERSSAKKPPLVSVVIPCLNRVSFIRSTIESVLKQTYSNIECIVVDGGSTDGTLEILREYENRLRWISGSDQGQGDAINQGWRMSRGDILAWLNADDEWKVPDAVVEAVQFFEANPKVDVVYGDSVDVNRKGQVVGSTYSREWDFFRAVEYCDPGIPQPASFIRRQIIEKVGGIDTSLRRIDHDLWLRIGLIGTIQHIPKPLARASNGRGASFEKVIAGECILVTKKFFSLPNVPETLFKKKKRIFSNAYIRAAEYAWLAGPHFSSMTVFGLKALWTDPSNAGRVVWKFFRCLLFLIKQKSKTSEV